MELYGDEWGRKGATLSDKTARRTQAPGVSAETPCAGFHKLAAAGSLVIFPPSRPSLALTAPWLLLVKV